ncbi:MULTISPECIES: rhombosortase [Marinobacter]|uniref:rhombosortase n=1 Tax=Marinobacter TaxID=2742 RepID=UPI0029420FA7|nr:rhombosortase [Marinobacter salarius]WOI20839.1 rhombosortase [Marinobacter salarius]
MTHTRSPQLFPYWQRFTVLAALLAAAFLWPASTLEWSREGIPDGEYWRLLTGHWVHLGLNHLLLNLAGLLVTGLLFTRHPPLPIWLSYLVLSPLAISSGLFLAAPELDWYRGFSGCLHGLLVFTALYNIRAETRWSLIILGFLLIKLATEVFLYPAVGENPLVGGRVIVQSHWLGAFAGLAAGLLTLSRAPRVMASPGPPSPE